LNRLHLIINFVWYSLCVDVPLRNHTHWNESAVWTIDCYTTVVVAIASSLTGSTLAIVIADVSRRYGQVKHRTISQIHEEKRSNSGCQPT